MSQRFRLWFLSVSGVRPSAGPLNQSEAAHSPVTKAGPHVSLESPKSGVRSELADSSQGIGFQGHPIGCEKDLLPLEIKLRRKEHQLEILKGSCMSFDPAKSWQNGLLIQASTMPSPGREFSWRLPTMLIWVRGINKEASTASISIFIWIRLVLKMNHCRACER